MTITTNAPLELVELIFGQGKVFTPALLPKEIKRGETGQCFDWCALQASKNPHLSYVEGLTSTPKSGEWLLHAWLTDGTYAFDPTWQAIDKTTKEEKPLPLNYIGLILPTNGVIRFMRETGYQGVLANRHRNPSLVQEMLKEQHYDLSTKTISK